VAVQAKVAAAAGKVEPLGLEAKEVVQEKVMAPLVAGRAQQVILQAEVEVMHPPSRSPIQVRF